MEKLPTPFGEEGIKLPFVGEGEVSTLGDLGISLTERRQEALIDFQEMTGLPALPMQDQLLSLEASIIEALSMPLQLIPTPISPETVIEAIPMPSEILPEGLLPKGIIPSAEEERPIRRRPRRARKPEVKEEEAEVAVSPTEEAVLEL